MTAIAAIIAACGTADSRLSAKNPTVAITTTAPRMRINQMTGGTSGDAAAIRPCRPFRRSSFKANQCS